MGVNYIVQSNSRISEITPILVEQLKRNKWFIKQQYFNYVEATRRNRPDVACQFHLTVDLSHRMGISVECHVDIGRWHHTPKDDTKFRSAMWRELNKIEIIKK